MAIKYVMTNKAKFYAQNASTEFQIAGSTGDVMFAALYKGNSTASTDLVVSAEGITYSHGAPDSYYEEITYTSSGLSVSTATAYGVTYVYQTAGKDNTTNVGILELAAPIIGVKKSVKLNSTVASSNTLCLDLTTDVGVVTSTGTTNSFINFSSLATLPQTVNLVGLSTTLWAVIGTESTVGAFDAVAGGIRSSEAVRAEV